MNRGQRPEPGPIILLMPIVEVKYRAGYLLASIPPRIGRAPCEVQLCHGVTTSIGYGVHQSS